MLTREETRVNNILETTITLMNKHYEIGWLWKTGNPKLTINRELAENRITSLEKKLERNPVLENQLKVRESDQDALRFLWPASKFENPVEYVMNVNLFDKNDSPCVANYGLKKCATDQ